MKRKVGKALGEAIILLVVSVFGIVMSILSHNSFNVEWKLSPYLFPLLISVFLLVLSIFLLIQNRNVEDKKKVKGDYRTLLFFALSCIIYLFIIDFLGFIISSILLLAAVMLLLGERRWWFILLLSISVSLILYVLFASYLSVMLPKGKILYYLGL